MTVLWLSEEEALAREFWMIWNPQYTDAPKRTADRLWGDEKNPPGNFRFQRKWLPMARFARQRLAEIAARAAYPDGICAAWSDSEHYRVGRKHAAADVRATLVASTPVSG